MNVDVLPNRSGGANWLVWGLLVLFLVGGTNVFPTEACAQQVPLEQMAFEMQPLSPEAQAKGGIQYVRFGQPKQALPLLEAAVAARPAFVHPTYGSAAYWLGEAYARTEDSAQARSVWRRGHHRLTEADRFDPRLTDAYLRTLSRRQLRNERLAAVDAYVRLLGHVGSDTSTALRALFRRRVAQIEPLLPDDVFARTVDGKRTDEPATWTFRADAGNALQTWWQRLDPFPATPENERLEEHLTRLVHAQRTFSCSDRTAALDARGITYLQYGSPFNRHPLSYQDAEFFKEVFRFGVPIPPAAFPKSEIWVYPQIDKSVYYLFAEKGTSDCFAFATTNDLLPNTLTMGRGNSERGLNIAYSSLMAMRAIYRELALYHPAFSARYSDIANYAGRQEMEAAIAEVAEATGEDYQPPGAGDMVTVGAGVGQTRRVYSNPTLGVAPLTQFVARMVSRADQADETAVRQREKVMPRQHTRLHEDTTKLPVALRTARFLNTDGTTRTEVYWGVSSAEARLQPEDDGEAPAPSMIRFSVVRHNADRSQAQRRRRHLRLPAVPSQQRPYFVGGPVAFQGATLHHLSMQWAQYPLRETTDGTRAALGTRHRFALARADSLQPLRAEGRLEMSDLKVLSLPDTSKASLTDPMEAATPYPFHTLSADTPLLLSFEVYHLAYDADDRTRYSVSYDVKGETRRGWTRLFRGQDTQRTRTTTTHEGTSRRSNEVILLDLSEIDREEAQDVRVTVRVTDETTGRTVARSIDFVLSPR